MPVINVFNRHNPYWYTFDPQLNPDEWVRKPPSYAYEIPEKEIRNVITGQRFPPPEGRELFAVTGIRSSESPNRVMAIHSSGRSQVNRNNGTMADAWLTATPSGKNEVNTARPIYDWEDGDVWKFINDMQLDYNQAYDVMYRMGVPRRQIRVAPPTQKIGAISQLQKIHGAWPQWFDKVCQRLPGVRSAVQFGTRALRPERQLGEDWQATYKRCVLGPNNPDWIRERGEHVMTQVLAYHSHHSTAPFPQASDCPLCQRGLNSWKQLAHTMYLGDPFGEKQPYAKRLEPDFFRPGAGKWDSDTPAKEATA
jgi:predicted phosphoadenosine phosphosulfate sulfurtransferase